VNVEMQEYFLSPNWSL